MKVAAKTLLVIVGLAALAWFLSRANLPEIGRALAQLGWLAPLLLLPYLVVYLADTAGWWFAFARRPSIGFLRFFRIRWAGEALNNIVPSAYVGGEALKIYLLGKRGLPSSVSAPAAVISKTVQTLAQMAFIALAGLAFLWLGGTSPVFRRAMAGVFVLVTVLVAGLLWTQRLGWFRVLFGLLRRCGIQIKSLAVRQAQLLEIDRQVGSYYLGARRRFLACFATYFVGWLLDTLEMLLAAWLLGTALSWPQAIAIEAFVSVAKVLGMFIPAAIGVQDSAIVFLSRMAGVPESFGFLYAVLRRGREVAFILLGWQWLLLEGTNLRGLARRVKAGADSTDPAALELTHNRDCKP